MDIILERIVKGYDWNVIEIVIVTNIIISIQFDTDIVIDLGKMLDIFIFRFVSSSGFIIKRPQ